MPAPGDDDTCASSIAAFPTVILRYDDARHGVALRSHSAGPLVARRFSGGSQAIPVDGGRCASCTRRSISRMAGGSTRTAGSGSMRVGRLARLSPPFRLARSRCRVCGGMARRGDDLVDLLRCLGSGGVAGHRSPGGDPSLLAPPLDRETRSRPRCGRRRPVATSSGRDTPAHGNGAQRHAARDASRAGEITPLSCRRVTIVSTTLTGNSRRHHRRRPAQRRRLGRLAACSSTPASPTTPWTSRARLPATSWSCASSRGETTSPPRATSR